MSETAGASAGASATTSTTSQAGATTAAGATEASGTSADQTKKVAQSADNDCDDIKIVSVSGKVPQQIAEAIKNLERGFQTKAQEAANNKKLLALANSNPEEFYRQTGKDPYSLAEELMLKKFEMDSLTPEQKRIRDLEAKNSEYEGRESAVKQQILNEIKEITDIPEGFDKKSKEEMIEFLQVKKQQYHNMFTSLDQEIGQAFKDSGLPADRFLVSKLAFEMRSSEKRGKPLTAKQALDKVNQEYFGGLKNTLGSMDVKRIHEMLGNDFLEKLRKYDLDQLTGNAASKLGQNFQNLNQGQTRVSSQEPKKYLNEVEWRKKYAGR
jgi:hypothetical protein